MKSPHKVKALGCSYNKAARQKERNLTKAIIEPPKVEVRPQQEENKLHAKVRQEDSKAKKNIQKVVNSQLKASRIKIFAH